MTLGLVDLRYHPSLSEEEAEGLDLNIPSVMQLVQECYQEADKTIQRKRNRRSSAGKAGPLIRNNGDHVLIESTKEQLFVICLVVCSHREPPFTQIMFGPREAIAKIARDLEKQILSSKKKDLKATIISKKWAQL